MKPKDIVRMKDSNINKVYGLGIVKKQVNDLFYAIQFQNTIHYVFHKEEDLLVIDTRDEVFNHLQSMIDCAVNPVDDTHCGLQDNYCGDDCCDCAVCPFNTIDIALRGIGANCIDTGYRKAPYCETDHRLIVHAKNALNFVANN